MTMRLYMSAMKISLVPDYAQWDSSNAIHNEMVLFICVLMVKV